MCGKMSLYEAIRLLQTGEDFLRFCLDRCFCSDSLGIKDSFISRKRSHHEAQHVHRRGYG